MIKQDNIAQLSVQWFKEENKSKNDVIVCVHAFIFTRWWNATCWTQQKVMQYSSWFQCESAYDNQICGWCKTTNMMQHFNVPWNDNESLSM